MYNELNARVRVNYNAMKSARKSLYIYAADNVRRIYTVSFRRCVSLLQKKKKTRLTIYDAVLLIYADTPYSFVSLYII